MTSSEWVTIGGNDNKHNPVSYTKNSCVGGKSQKGVDFAKGTSTSCVVGQTIPPEDDVRCQPIGLIAEGETVERVWLDEYDGDKMIRLGCLSSALDSITAFGRRKSSRGKTLDLDILYRMIEQDALDHAGTNKFYSGTSGKAEYERIKYCNTTPVGYKRLVNAVNTKKLPNKICVPDDSLYNTALTKGMISSTEATYKATCQDFVPSYDKAACDAVKEADGYKSYDLKWEESTNRCKIGNSEYCHNGQDIVKKKVVNNSSVAKQAVLSIGEMRAELVKSYKEKGYIEHNYITTFEECEDANGIFVYGDNICFCEKNWENDTCPEERE
jgi:hypothetical protein